MFYNKICQILVASCILLGCFLASSLAAPVRTDLSQIDLLSERSSIEAGSSFYIAVELIPDQGWHAYWENPGDAGLKLEVKWQAPDGFNIGPLQFPTPELIPYQEIVSYGYNASVTVIAKVDVPQGFTASDVTINGDAFWLTCSDTLCVPQEAKVSINLAVGENIINQPVALLIEGVKKNMPVSVNWPSQFHRTADNITIVSDVSEKYQVIESAYLFPRNEGVIENTYIQELSFVDGQIIGRFKNAYDYQDIDNFEYVLVINSEGQKDAYLIKAQQSLVAIAPALIEEEMDIVSPVSTISLVSALFFAFIGGLILNLMPCVFPILSLKALSVVELSKKSPSEVRLSGLLYTSGVLLCFGLVGIGVTSLSLGWGFQMQMPLVNFILGLLMVVIALNLFGLFELGSSIVNLGQGLISGQGYSLVKSRRATFFTGFLAVIVATPCTAPFMAGALGFALAEGGFVGLLIFLMLGLGLAFPYLLICYIPGFQRILPRPGLWMENMRKVLGFPMLATAIWLFWILGKQLGIDAMAISILAGLLLSFALWGLSKNSISWKVVSIISVLAVVYCGFYLSSLSGNDRVYKNDMETGATEFSSDKMQALLDENQAVFVYFTAEWCVTCKLNEKIALSTPEVNDAFKDRDITVMVGDWTNQNPDITKTLRRYGRIGVPLYLYFKKGTKIDNPKILPQILTPNIVIEAL